MQVFLPAIVGHMPPQMVRALSAFMEFCYLVCCSQIDEDTLTAIDAAVKCFYRDREIFIEAGIRDDFLLPRQHSIIHYHELITLFGALNGVCSSITESKHIKAVKEPWRHSSCNQPLRQMLLTNQHLDKLSALRVDFETQGMLGPLSMLHMPQSTEPPHQEEQVRGHDHDVEIVEGMTSLGDVKLARHPGLCHFYDRSFKHGDDPLHSQGIS